MIDVDFVVSYAAKKSDNSDDKDEVFLQDKLNERLVREVLNDDKPVLKRVGVIKHLISLGASENARVKKIGNSVLVLAKLRGEKEIEQCLIEAGAKEFRLSYDEAKKLGENFWDKSWDHFFDRYVYNLKSDEEVSDLIDMGADANACRNYGKTVLMDVVLSGNLKNAEKLIKSGAKVNELDFDGNGVLTNAVVSDDEKMLGLLFGYGAKIDFLESNGKKIFKLAVNRGNEKIISMLKENNKSKVDLEENKSNIDTFVNFFGYDKEK